MLAHRQAAVRRAAARAGVQVLPPVVGAAPVAGAAPAVVCPGDLCPVAVIRAAKPPAPAGAHRVAPLLAQAAGPVRAHQAVIQGLVTPRAAISPFQVWLMKYPPTAAPHPVVVNRANQAGHPVAQRLAHSRANSLHKGAALKAAKMAVVAQAGHPRAAR